MKDAITRWLRPSFAAVLISVVLLFGLIPTSQADTQDDRAELVGTITTLPATQGWIGDWVVGRTKVKVTDATKIDQTRAKVAVGALVEVKGTKQNDGSILATEISVKLNAFPGLPISFTGKIDELPSSPSRAGDWKVSGRIVHVSATTKIDQSKGQVAVGVPVEVDGLIQLDGSVNATEIEVKPATTTGIPVEFLGKVEKLPSTQDRSGDWVISGRTVKVIYKDTIKSEHGEVMIGSLVKVQGIVQLDGSIIATRIDVLPSIEPPVLSVYFRGTVEMLPPSNGTVPGFIGDWKVSGRTVHVAVSTPVNEDRGKVAIGATVEISGTLANDGSVSAQKIAVIGTPTPNLIRFTGKVSVLPPSNGIVPGFIGDWKVGDRVVHVAVATKVNEEKGKVAIGAVVEVVGAERQDKSVDATTIEVKETTGTVSYVRFFGTLTQLPAASIQVGNGLAGDWMVGGKTIHVVPQTRISQEHGRVVVGAYLEIEGNQRTDGSIDPVGVEVERDAGAPAGAIGFIDFYGPIRTLPSSATLVGDWVIDGKTVHVTTNTKLEQPRVKFASAVYVHVNGYLLADGSVSATKIESRTSQSNGDNRSFIEFIGTVTALPTTANFAGDWTVAGRTVHVDRRTKVSREQATIAIGATVEINGAELPDGSVDATFIEVGHGPTGARFVEFAPLTSVNAGSYLEGSAASAIIASFGSDLANGVEVATGLPLPTELGGVSVLIDGNPAGLFFVSPGQINYQVPEELLPGAAQVAVMKNGQVVAQGALELEFVAPSLFTADASGTGAPSGVLLRVRANGEQSYEPLVRYDGGRATPVTITRNAGDRLFLVLYGTGWRGADDADGNSGNGVAESIKATIGDATAPVVFAGSAPGFAGLDQMNVEIPVSVTGKLDLLVKVDDGNGVVLRANVVAISIR
ncbi:MAG: DUF5666 domain-containing protein [Acidobacteriota bacterium]